MLNRNKSRAMTLTEMIVAMAIMVIVMAAIVPQIYAIQKSWGYNQSNSEIVQNGRVLMDHFNSNLSQATRITAVSPSTSNSGYIEYLDNDGNTVRYDINERNFVEFGRPGLLSELAGPVLQLNFVCRDANSMSTTTTDPNRIREVTVSALIQAPDNPALSKNFTTTALLRTNALADRGAVTQPFLIKNTDFKDPAICSINSSTCLAVYEGEGSDGFATILSTNISTKNISVLNSYIFDSAGCKTPAIVRISSSYYLCVYAGSGDRGTAVVLRVDPFTSAISQGSTLVLTTDKGMEPSLAQIDGQNYLCVFRGDGDKGYAVVLTVNVTTKTVTKGPIFLFDSYRCFNPDLVNIDSGYFMCAYRGKDDDGYAVILGANPYSHTVSILGAAYEFDTEKCDYPHLMQIGLYDYLCTYTGKDDDGFAALLKAGVVPTVMLRTSSYEFDPKMGKFPFLAYVDSHRGLAVYQADHSVGKAAILRFDTFPGNIEMEVNNTFDAKHCVSSILTPLSGNWFLCVYQGDGNRGYAVLINSDMEILP